MPSRRSAETQETIDQIVAYLTAGNTGTSKEIAAATGIHPRAVSAALSEAYKHREVERTASGGQKRRCRWIYHQAGTVLDGTPEAASLFPPESGEAQANAYRKGLEELLEGQDPLLVLSWATEKLLLQSIANRTVESVIGRQYPITMGAN